MKHLTSFNNFGLNEAKKETSPLDLFKKDVKSLIDDMFASSKKVKYDFDKAGFPAHVEFEIEKSDFKVDYDKEIRAEYSEGVIKKREFEAILEFDDKWEEKKGEKNVFMISFDIKKEKIDPEKYKKEEKQRKYNFKKDSDEQLKKKIQSDKFTEEEKDEMIEILVDRGVEYEKDDKDEENEETEEEMDKKAKSEAKKKEKRNEAFDPELESEEGFEVDMIGPENDEIGCDCGKPYCLICHPELSDDFKQIEIPDIDDEEECHCQLCGESLVTDSDIKPTKCDCGQPGCKDCNPGPECNCGKPDCKICNPKCEYEKPEYKEVPCKESKVLKFGSSEWCEKYKVDLVEEKKEESLEEKVYRILNNKE